MTKQEFLEGLRERLLEEGADVLVPENLNYYDSYIEEEKQKGRTEEDVLAELGNPALSVLADAYAKGIRGFDTEKAFETAVRTSEKFQGSSRSISEVLEYSYSDWCLAVYSKAIGKDSEADHYFRRSLRYRDLFNPETGWFQPKDDDGNWVPYPEKGRLSQGFGCMESNPYQQGWLRHLSL